MKIDPQYYRYNSKRTVTYGSRGAVATSNPLAAQAGLDIIKKGGNAIDAAIATAAALTVTEPTGNGIGGDAFALVWAGGKIYGLNASGFAPELMTRESFVEKGLTEIPKYGFDAVTVPGIPAAWSELSQKFGKLTLLECLEPAIKYARDGFVLSPTVGRGWKRSHNLFKNEFKSEEFKNWFDHFIPEGVCPEAGDIWKSEETARTLEELGETNCESFYRGRLAKVIGDFSKKYNGYLRESDLNKYKPEWVTPISMNYKGYDVYEIPPNGHGITVLMALNILKGLDLKEKENPETYHKIIESLKLAFADTKKYVTDINKMSVTVEELLSEKYGDKRRELIGETAIMPEAGDPSCGGTVYLSTADGEGNMVSYIQSNYMGFGSGIVVPGTGIALQNRGNNFTLDENHDNVVEPFKKPYHTIIPGFLAQGDTPIGPFGVMGGFMQPQGHLQVLINTIEFGHNPQEALDAPRWQWTGGKVVEVESEFPAHIAQALQDMGHEIKMTHSTFMMGRGQIIWRMKNGTLACGTEPRCDGHVAVW